MERVSQSQLIMLYALIIYGGCVGFVLTGMTQAAGYVGWLTFILGWAGSLLIVLMVLKIAALQPDNFITRFGGQLIGRWPHLFIMAFNLYHILHLAATIMRELCDFIIQTYLQVTPAWAISSLFGLCTILAVRSGIETIFRCAEGFFFIVIGTVLVTPFLLTANYNWAIAGAFLHHWELSSIRTGTITAISLFADSMLVLYFYPHLQNKEKTFRSLALGSGIALVLIVMTLVICILNFGVHLTAHMSYPTLEMMRMIRVGDFLDNMDPFLIAIWMSSLFLKISLYLHVLVAAAGQLMGLKHSKPLAFSIGAIMIGLSGNIAISSVEVQDFLRKGYPAMTYLVESTLLLYLAGYWWQSRKKKNPLEAPSSA
jgi:spore germination protein KB